MEKKKRSSILTVVILAAVILLFVVMNLVGVQVKASDSAVKINGPLFAQSADYDEIAKLELRSAIDYGRRAFGADYIGIKAGTFRNTEFGDYQCAVYSSVSGCVVLQKKDGTTIVFNCSSEEKTKEIFEKLQQKLPTE